MACVIASRRLVTSACVYTCNPTVFTNGARMISTSSTIYDNNQRDAVLSVYRQILRAGRHWENVDERPYIINEAKSLFRENRDINDQELIRSKLFEAESRLELGKHYKIPYPRMPYAQPMTTVKSKTMADKVEQVIPAYMHSYGAKAANTTPTTNKK